MKGFFKALKKTVFGVGKPIDYVGYSTDGRPFTNHKLLKDYEGLLDTIKNHPAAVNYYENRVTPEFPLLNYPVLEMTLHIPGRDYPTSIFINPQGLVISSIGSVGGLEVDYERVNQHREAGYDWVVTDNKEVINVRLEKGQVLTYEECVNEFFKLYNHLRRVYVEVN